MTSKGRNAQRKFEFCGGDVTYFAFTQTRNNKYHGVFRNRKSCKFDLSSEHEQPNSWRRSIAKVTTSNPMTHSHDPSLCFWSACLRWVASPDRGGMWNPTQWGCIPFTPLSTIRLVNKILSSNKPATIPTPPLNRGGNKNFLRVWFFSVFPPHSSVSKKR